MIFDTHAHYDDEAFDEDREQLLASFKENGIDAFTNVAASLSSCKTTLELARNHDFMYAALGVHPSESAELSDEGLKDIETWCTERQDGKVRAIGEIGLDYYWEEPDHETQKKWFHRQLNLARELKLPVIIHSRDAAKDTLDIMKEEHSGEIGGVIHCFSYGKEMAAEYLKMGFYLGIGGVLTFKNAKKLLEVAEMAPLDRLVLETDCPYLAPVPNRGKRNSSLNLPYVAEKLAEFGAEMIFHEVYDDDASKITDGCRRAMEAGADLVFCTGGMSVDPDDKTPLAIKNTGARIVSYGAPVLPGAMFLLAYAENGTPIVGLPGCVMYSERTIFDLVLPRLIADDEVTAEELAGLGEGGLCLNCKVCTFPNCGFGKGR